MTLYMSTHTSQYRALLIGYRPDLKAHEDSRQLAIERIDMEWWGEFNISSVMYYGLIDLDVPEDYHMIQNYVHHTTTMPIRQYNEQTRPTAVSTYVTHFKMLFHPDEVLNPLIERDRNDIEGLTTLGIIRANSWHFEAGDWPIVLDHITYLFFSFRQVGEKVRINMEVRATEYQDIQQRSSDIPYRQQRRIHRKVREI